MKAQDFVRSKILTQHRPLPAIPQVQPSKLAIAPERQSAKAMYPGRCCNFEIDATVQALIRPPPNTKHCYLHLPLGLHNSLA